MVRFQRVPRGAFADGVKSYETLRRHFATIAESIELDAGGTLADVIQRLERVENASRENHAAVPREILTLAEAIEFLPVVSDKLFELTEPVGPILCRRDGKRLICLLADLRGVSRTPRGGDDMSYSISVTKRGERSYYMRLHPYNQSKKINIALGAINAKLADKIRGNVDQLLRAHEHPELHPPASTLQWVREQSADLQSKLAEAGLIPGRAPGMELKKFLTAYIKAQNLQDSTIDQLWVVARSLCQHLGDTRDATSITLSDAIGYRNAMLRSGGSHGKPMADNSVRRYVGRAGRCFAVSEAITRLPTNLYR
jgi:hypothetical protein